VNLEFLKGAAATGWFALGIVVLSLLLAYGDVVEAVEATQATTVLVHAALGSFHFASAAFVFVMWRRVRNRTRRP